MEVAGGDDDQMGGVDEAAEGGLDVGGCRGGDALLELGVPGEVAAKIEVLGQVGGQLAIGGVGDFTSFQEAGFGRGNFGGGEAGA